jgi:hypothetical protein
MIKIIHTVSSSFFLSLLGLYVVGKLGITLGWWGGIVVGIDNLLIPPLGFVTLVYIASSIKEELQRLHIHHVLYDILLISFLVVFTGILLFIRFIVTSL